MTTKQILQLIGRILFSPIWFIIQCTIFQVLYIAISLSGIIGLTLYTIGIDLEDDFEFKAWLYLIFLPLFAPFISTYYLIKDREIWRPL